MISTKEVWAKSYKEGSSLKEDKTRLEKELLLHRINGVETFEDLRVQVYKLVEMS